MREFARFAIIPIIASIFLAGCADFGDPAALAPVSFSNDIQPIFNQNCTANCHNSQNAPNFGNLDLTTYVALMDTIAHAKEIVPGDPDASYLVQRIERTVGLLMPPTEPLPPNDISLIRQWVAEGALDN